MKPNNQLSLRFNNSYAKLPKTFFSECTPEQSPQPSLVKINRSLALELGFDSEKYAPDHLAQVFSGNVLLTGSQPLAQAYAGHQFGGLSPQLGDGRACLLGEVKSASGHTLDLQLKGSGRTAFSRRGDGKATLYSVLREYLISEAMFALGIPTTRSLAVVASGENIIREGSQAAGVLTRVASSHIRVGTFQYFAIRGDLEAVKTLADYTINKHYPELNSVDNPYLALLESVMENQIHLITQWIRVGFIHGVMNTDNVTISGETIDYGPCAFLDTYDPNAKFSSIDTQGRYAFSSQGPIGLWNLARFAETLITLVDDDEDEAIKKLTQVLESYADKFENQYSLMMQQKFCLSGNTINDEKIVKDFLNILQTDNIDYTLAFRALTTMVDTNFTHDELDKLVTDHDKYFTWKTTWKNRVLDESGNIGTQLEQMQLANPIYIPRNWYVEQALTSAAQNNDYTIFNEMLEVLKTPYTSHSTLNKYATTPHPSTSDYKTFCGT